MLKNHTVANIAIDGCIFPVDDVVKANCTTLLNREPSVDLKN